MLGMLVQCTKDSFAVLTVACVAGAKRGGEGGREKGTREGSACSKSHSKSLCFCITPTKRPQI